MLCYLALGFPLVAGALVALVPWRPWLAVVGVASSAGVLATGVALARTTLHARAVVALDGGLRADPLSSFMVVVIGVVALLATSQGWRTVDPGPDAPAIELRRATRYTALVQVFITCMVGAVLAASLGAMWVAIEATTVATTFLVGHLGTRRALEASWKYVITCSLGIALAFLGSVLVYFAALHAGVHGAGSLDWTSLMAVSRHLDPGVMRLAMALVVLGYGTKVGLAPMHSWLPDAHGEAPAPVSALMSGVLLSVAFYALLRFKAVADGALGPGFARGLLVGAGLLSLGVAASLLVAQRDLKRLLAYSSLEHMGLLALGAAAGTPLALAAVLLHILGHGVAKAVAFLAAGEIVRGERTSVLAGVGGILSRRPVLGGIFGFSLAALLGLPPFSIFVSELTMVRAEFGAGLGWAAGASLVFVVVIFGAVAQHARHLLLGDDGLDGPDVVESSDGARTATLPASVVVPLVAALGLSAFLGISSWPLAGLLHAAAHVVTP